MSLNLLEGGGQGRGGTMTTKPTKHVQEEKEVNPADSIKHSVG